MKKGHKASMTRGNHKRRPGKLAARLGVAVLALATTVGITACSGDEAEGGGGSVDLVAYSTPQQAYEEGLIPAFEDTDTGSGTEFSTSFGSSGDQSRAVEAGQSADYVSFSIEPDMTRLVDAGIVRPDWNKRKHDGIVTDSVVVFMTRPGNPEGIQSWEDLVNKDVEIINPNPATSGGARWNIMAAYGSQLTNGKSEQESLDFVEQIVSQTSVQDDSARDSLATFQGGKGDVLIGYENEAIQAQKEGVELEMVIPDDTILIENPAAVTVDSDPTAAKFLDFVQSSEGQTLFAEAGYRPVDPAVAEQFADQFPQPTNLFTIDEFGGWDVVADEFFDDENGSIFEIQRELGNPTE
jgi:sulfate/thiosulfate transport system substrate-binding protein